ncbi:MAG: hypothetical protein WD690_13235 [Vicinamibacterales bacterium]
MLRTTLAAVAMVLATTPVFGQEPPTAQRQVETGATELYELVLKDGSRAFGTVEREDEREVVFRTHAGAVLTAQRQEIVSLRIVKGRIQNGEFVRSDSHHTRLFFAPTARSLEKGQVSVGVFEFLAPFVQVGVTDRFSIGGGTPLVIGIDEDFRPFWVTPKFQVHRGENTQVAVGVLQMFNSSGDSGGIAYGVATFGSSDNAVTAGAGIAYSGDSSGGVVMVGGERRAHRNLKLITENYVWQEGNGIVSGGIRFLGERLSADLALAVPIGAGDFIAFPVVNFVYLFGSSTRR